MSHIGEFELIGRIAAQFQQDSRFQQVPDVAGIGDDCAVLPQRAGVDTLVTTDLLIEDRHFLLSDVTPEQLGWKSAAVNISDIAAMGGRPTATFLSIALPKSLDVEWVDRFIAGFSELSARFGVPLLGGDTSASPDKLFINVTVLGECPHGQAVMRSGARPGDLICVTGTLGDSAAGLKLVLERTHNLASERTAEDVLIRRHYLPMPRVAEGQALAAVPGVHSMMDISDGIASDLRHILSASSGPCASAGTEESATSILAAAPLRLSNAGSSFPPPALHGPLVAEIDLKALPLSDELKAVCSERGWDANELAVSGGEDYELLLTLAPEALDAAQAALGGGLTVIGRIVDSRSEPGMTEGRPGMTEGRPGMTEGEIRWLGSDKEYHGFTHF